MPTQLSFYLTSIGLGFALAMDAFSVSLANGLNEPCMRERKMCGIAGVFAFFQALMPMLGWLLVHTLVEYFTVFEKFIPWIALALLCFIGVKMLIEGLKNEDECPCSQKGLGFGALVVQGIATSIDALSTGFTISEYNWFAALLCALIIGVLTFIICMFGLFIGRRSGTKLAGKAGVLGGVILIAIGIWIFAKGVFGIG